MSHGHGNEQHPKAKRKQSLSNWSQFATVSWPQGAKSDFEEFTSVALERESMWAKFWLEAESWFVPALVGIFTATSGALIEWNVEWFADWRLGYCPWRPFYSMEKNCPEWVEWSEVTSGYMMYIFVCTLIAGTSAFLTWAFAPMSRGSGIPEVKTVLGGFDFPEVLEANTLVVKVIGLSMSVGAGLSCGKEGPLIHIACCWGNCLAKCFPRYRDNKAKTRELISASCAAGVAVAFGAPLGGVLFSYEEGSTLFPLKVMLRAFFSATFAAMTLAWWDPTGTGKLTMFGCQYSIPPHFIEYPIFVVMGLLGGLFGAVFVHYNMKISVGRMPGTWFRNRCHIILEVAALGFFTAATSYHMLWTRVLSSVSIRAMFHDCKDMTVDRHKFMLDLCDGDMPAMGTTLCLLILATGVLRHIQMTFTFGTGAAAGLFIPSLLAGACMGRVIGIMMYQLNEEHHFVLGPGSTPTHFVNGIQPGMYGMLGAAALLGGVCRVTISLVVIMFELTGGLQLIVPFMVVCMIAKWVGDSFTQGIYDYIITIRKYPYLHEPDEVSYNNFAEDVMDEALVCMHPDAGTLGPLIQFLDEAKYSGYPLVRSAEDPTLLGYVRKGPLSNYLKREKVTNVFAHDESNVGFAKYMIPAPPKGRILDISKFCDETVLMVTRTTPAAHIHTLFRRLGVEVILVVDSGSLCGMITKKAFIKHVEELHHHENAESRTKGDLQQALLPGGKH